MIRKARTVFRSSECDARHTDVDEPSDRDPASRPVHRLHADDLGAWTLLVCLAAFLVTFAIIIL